MAPLSLPQATDGTSHYEPPALIEVGDFATLTLGRFGNGVDNQGRDFNYSYPEPIHY